ncbi:hypothetical protein MWH25_04845 [Natroniella acetigena]|nr:hypothetical protein [Natroniella acetigena]MCK8827074.1 hypothetical protein [Natroniella acetigena]
MADESTKEFLKGAGKVAVGLFAAGVAVVTGKGAKKNFDKYVNGKK